MMFQLHSMRNCSSGLLITGDLSFPPFGFFLIFAKFVCTVALSAPVFHFLLTGVVCNCIFNISCLGNACSFWAPFPAFPAMKSYLLLSIDQQMLSWSTYNGVTRWTSSLGRTLANGFNLGKADFWLIWGQALGSQQLSHLFWLVSAPRWASLGDAFIWIPSLSSIRFLSREARRNIFWKFTFASVELCQNVCSGIHTHFKYFCHIT